MIRILGLASVVALTACTSAQSTPAQSAAAPTPAEQVARVEAVTQHELGIGQNELTFLIDADPGTVYTGRSMKIETRRKALDALERAGYITITKLGSADEPYLKVDRTEKGQAVATLILSRP